MLPEPPSFDLIVATVGRVEQLGRLFDSLEAQTHRDFRAVVVDQNEDDRVEAVLAGRNFDVLHLRSAPGLSRARNVGLARVAHDVVAFPDDDCTYPADLLARVAERLAGRELDGLTGRAADADGRSAPSWKQDAVSLTRENLWNRAISFTIFLRREVVERVGAFDERLGLGSSARWSSGEEIDYLVRALDGMAQIEYDPTLVVRHHLGVASASLGYRDGASVGYVLRKHGYPAPTVARMAVRPVGGVIVALARRDRARARFYAATLRGRIAGYRRARSSNSAA